MLYFAFLFLLLIIESTFPQVKSKVCLKGQYSVRSHSRRAYVKANGTVVAATQVVASCKDYSNERRYLNDRFKVGVPADWPYRTEEPSKWSDGEMSILEEVLKELPETLVCASAAPY